MKKEMKCIAAVLLALAAQSCAHEGAPARSAPAAPVATRGEMRSTGGPVAPCMMENRPNLRGKEMNGHLLWGVEWRVEDDPTSGGLFEQVRGEAPLDGTRLRGFAAPGQRFTAVASDGKTVDLAVCGVATDAKDKDLHWYSLQYWDEVVQAWKNPCVGTKLIPVPRALALSDLWDRTGARSQAGAAFTFACENGALAKCARWGYKPWQQRRGRSLADYHQSCTRMVRADYCGNGSSHTKDLTVIDMYDDLEIQIRTTDIPGGGDPHRLSFEAAWSPDGAYCLDRTRDDKIDEVLGECPDRFSRNIPQVLGQGDQCAFTRTQRPRRSFLLRNRS